MRHIVRGTWGHHTHVQDRYAQAVFIGDDCYSRLSGGVLGIDMAMSTIATWDAPKAIHLLVQGFMRCQVQET